MSSLALLSVALAAAAASSPPLVDASRAVCGRRFTGPLPGLEWALRNSYLGSRGACVSVFIKEYLITNAFKHDYKNNRKIVQLTAALISIRHDRIYRLP